MCAFGKIPHIRQPGVETLKYFPVRLNSSSSGNKYFLTPVMAVDINKMPRVRDRYLTYL